MSHIDDIKAVLVADSGIGGVATVLTGGIYTYAETGRLGIDRNRTPDAFSGGYLQPCGVVKARPQVASGQVVGSKPSYRQVVEIWLYNDGDAGYSTLEAVAGRVFTLLHDTVLANGGVVLWVHTLAQEREAALDHAAMLRVDFAVYNVQEG